MSDQATPPASGQSTSPPASPQYPPPPSSAAAEARDAAFLAAYDILRPAGEVDARAQHVLVTAFVLIALCVVPQKPASFSFGGLSFSLRHWLALAIPLCVVLLYWMVEFVVAWKIQWRRVIRIFGKTIKSIRAQAHNELEPLITGGRAFREEQDIIEAKRKEIYEWYKQRREEVSAQNRALEEADRFPNDSFSQQWKNSEAVDQEWKEREQQAGITAFDQKRDELFHTGFKQADMLLLRNKEALDEMDRLLDLKQTRLRLGLVVPALVAAFALLTFAWAIHAS
jgi:hypothetical protein